MYYGAIKKTDISNGTGVRVSLFVSGCTHHCKGCFNEETWDFNYGTEYTSQTQTEIIRAMNFPYISGLSILGGEPFEPENQKVLVNLLIDVKKKYPDKDIWCYTGYIFEKDLLCQSRARCEYTDEMLQLIDVLVDGPFILSKKNLMLRFRGSDNQRLINVKKSLESGNTILYE